MQIGQSLPMIIRALLEDVFVYVIITLLLGIVKREFHFLVHSGSYCTQLIWMKQRFSDYGLKQNVMTLVCDNMSAISIFKNHVQRSRTKYIDIRYHFIRDLVEEKVISLEHISTENQLVDLFTKSLDTLRFEFLRKSLGVYFLE